MILNVSGRTDIVAFYTPWFMNRYKEGYVDVRNPFFSKKVSRINFSDVDLIVFCTKNPLPIIPYLKEIKQSIVFHVTLTPYKNDIEPNVINKSEIIEGIKAVSKIVGIENTYVRYDPILLNGVYSIFYHVKAFERMCSLLYGYVKHIIISFVDDYKNVKNNAKFLKLKDFSDEDYKIIGESFSRIANKYKMTIQTCYEENDLTQYGFIKQDKKWQARKCNCVEMVDIGAYNSCYHLCKYCYANYEEKKVKDNLKLHNVNSSLLLGNLSSDDEIIIRQNK